MDLKHKHINDGKCLKCKEIMDAYGGTDPDLRKWFETLQKERPDAHLSASGRNKSEQEFFFKSGKSKARFSQSPHNYSPSLAIDIFRMGVNGADYNLAWYKDLIIPLAEAAGFEAGGNWTKFKDYPHFQLKNWKELVKEGKVKLIE